VWSIAAGGAIALATGACFLVSPVATTVPGMVARRRLSRPGVTGLA
jgi:hypothetical protein